MATRPQDDNALGLLNIHEDREFYCVEVEVRRDEGILRYRRRFLDLEEAIKYRNACRYDADLPPAEDR